MADAIVLEYAPAERVNYYNSEEGYWMGPEPIKTDEFLDSILGHSVTDDHKKFFEDFKRAMPSEYSNWNKLADLKQGEFERMMSAWTWFTQLIQTERRYFFRDQELTSSKYANRSVPSVEKFFSDLGGALERFDALKRLSAGLRVYRARHIANASGETLNWKDMGPPPAKSAGNGRMSAAGIPMFYTAEDERTAFLETYAGPTPNDWFIGEFELLHDVWVLDLARLDASPSVFSKLPTDEKDLLRFLNEFKKAIISPVNRDDSHADYVPSQVVAEYFRHMYIHEGEPLRGIRFRSSRTDGINIAFFCARDGFEVFLKGEKKLFQLKAVQAGVADVTWKKTNYFDTPPDPPMEEGHIYWSRDGLWLPDKEGGHYFVPAGPATDGEAED